MTLRLGGWYPSRESDVKRKTRIYIKTSEGIHRPVFWVCNNKPNEMLLGLYGLAQKVPLLQYQWPETEVGENELCCRYYYEDKVEVNARVDHITCHADGKFHIKTKNEGQIYIHRMKRSKALGPDSETFLEFIMLVDIPERYTSNSKKPDTSSVIYDQMPGNYLYIYGRFAGKNFQFDKIPLFANDQYKHRDDTLHFGSFKGQLISDLVEFDSEAPDRRPVGTFLSFRFPVKDELWRLKTFQFS